MLGFSIFGTSFGLAGAIYPLILAAAYCGQLVCETMQVVGVGFFNFNNLLGWLEVLVNSLTKHLSGFSGLV